MVAVAGLRAGVGLELHAQRGLVVVRGLGGVADHEHDRVPAGHREGSLLLVVLHQPDQLLELLEGQVGLQLVGGQGVGQRVGHAPQHVADRHCVQQYARIHCATCPVIGGDMDHLDATLLRLLADEPRIGVLEASRRLGVARGTVQARLDKLAQAGVISGWGPELAPGGARLPGDRVPHPGDPPGTAERQSGHEAVARHLARIPEVLEAHTITGAGDMWARVVARSNADLQRVIDAVLADAGIVRSSTVIALATQIPYRVLPLMDAAVEDSAGR